MNARSRPLDEPHAVPAPSVATRVMAYAAPLTVLPSALWRLAALLGLYGEGHPLTAAIRGDVVWVVVLSIGSVAATALTIGLVRPWGLIFPKFLPVIGGRTVPVGLAVIPGGIGATLGIAAAGYAVLNGVFHFVTTLDPDRRPFQLAGSEEALVMLLYVPMLFTGLLVGLVVWDYARRRRSVRSR